MKHKYLLSGVIALVIAGLFSAPGGASSFPTNAPFTVNSVLDQQDANPGDGQCLSTPSGACTLRAAIQEANAFPGADTIGFSITGTIYFTSSFGITESLTIIGPGANLLTWYANYNTGSSLVSFNQVGGNFSIFGIRISGTGTPAGISVGNGSATFTDVIVTGMGSPSGLMIAFANASATLVHSSIINNHSPGGGGIYNLGGTLRVIESTISGNGSSFGGGGIYNTGTATITSSAILSNTTGSGVGGGSGGGIYNTGTLALMDSTVSGNLAQVTANNHGGGIASSGILTIANSTIANNGSSLGLGGGLRVISGTVTVQNTIIADSSAGGDCSQGGGTIINGGFNLVEDNSCGFAGGADPLLAPLGNNAGPTLTQALMVNSPAVDAGNPTGCTDAFGATLAFDQRGYFRAIDGDGNTSQICDMGAYEYNSIPPSSWLYLPLINR